MTPRASEITFVLFFSTIRALLDQECVGEMGTSHTFSPIIPSPWLVKIFKQLFSSSPADHFRTSSIFFFPDPSITAKRMGQRVYSFHDTGVSIKTGGVVVASNSFYPFRLCYLIEFRIFIFSPLRRFIEINEEKKRGYLSVVAAVTVRCLRTFFPCLWDDRQ